MKEGERIVVLGLGNILLSDEGVGVHAVRALEADFELPAGVEAIDGGVSAMDCLDRIANCDLLLIADVVKSGRAPGELVRLADDELQAFFRTRISPHQVGLSDVLATLLVHDLSPRRVTVVGVEPSSFALGLEPTPLLQARLPDLVQALVSELSAAGARPRRRDAPLALER